MAGGGGENLLYFYTCHRFLHYLTVPVKLVALPLQKWICAAYVLRLWCSECCTCVSCTYVQNMCKLLPYLIYAQHVCYLCMQHVLLAHMHATGMLHKCFLQVCMLQRAAYMPLTHMQATSVPHMCSLHTCMLLQCCIHAAYNMQATSVPHMCSLHTCILLQCCIHAAYTHASYSVPHMCSLHTCMLLQCCIHAAYTHASY